MRIKKKLIKRMGALLCAIVVAVSAFVSSPYFAMSWEDSYNIIVSNTSDLPASAKYAYEIDTSLLEKYPYYVVIQSSSEMYILYSNKPYSFYINYRGTWSQLVLSCVGTRLQYVCSDGSTWSSQTTWNGFTFWTDIVSSGRYTRYYNIIESNHDLYLTNVIGGTDFDDIVIFGANHITVPTYNSSFGYLQNVRENKVYDKVPLGEVANDKFVARWYFDSLSTTGVDLSSGDYSIRYYQERWLVKGYNLTDDVIEKSDRYLIGEYPCEAGYLQTYSENVNEILYSQGYEEPSFWDLLWNKFVNTHHYFQIVNNSTNEVGGYLHVYYSDDTGKFGTEYIGETLDNEGNYDDSGYKDIIVDDSITSDDVESGFAELEQDNEQTLEEWLEDLKGFQGDGLDDMDGANIFSDNLHGYALQIGNVTQGIGALFGVLPDWVLGLLGVSFACLFVLIVFKVARG